MTYRFSSKINENIKEYYLSSDIKYYLKAALLLIYITCASNLQQQLKQKETKLNLD